MAAAATYFRSFLTAWRKLAVAVVFLGMLTVGYLTMSVATSCPVQAQMCSCGICVLNGPTSVSALFATVTSQTTTQIGTATQLITAQYSLAASAFTQQATSGFGQVVMDITDWFDTFWYYNEKPSLQAQAEQANVMDSIQAVTLSTFRDGAELLRTNQLLSALELESARELQPAASVCVAATSVGGLARAQALSEAYATAAAAEAAPRSAGARGTSAEGGRLGDMRVRWQAVQQNYCAPGENNAGPDCQASGALINADIDVNGTVFARDTIDLTDPQVKAAVDALVTNIAEPFVTNNVSAAALESTGGIDAAARRDDMRAKRQTIHNALQYTVARRAPSGGAAEFIAAIRESAGIAPDLISANPSYHEIMEAIANERYRTGQYAVEQIDTPANAERDLTIQNAIQVMQTHDQLELLDRAALMLAAEMGLEARELRSYNSMSGARPQQ